MNSAYVTNKTGRYAIHKINLFQNSGFDDVTKNGASKISNTFNGGGIEMSAL